MFYHTYKTHIEPYQKTSGGGGLEDVIGAGVLAAIGVASAPLWLPALAAKGAAIISAKGAGLTAAALVTGVKLIIKGKAPKAVAKEIATGAAIGVAIEAPLEEWLKEIQDLVLR